MIISPETLKNYHGNIHRRIRQYFPSNILTLQVTPISLLNHVYFWNKWSCLFIFTFKNSEMKSRHSYLSQAQYSLHLVLRYQHFCLINVWLMRNTSEMSRSKNPTRKDSHLNIFTGYIAGKRIQSFSARIIVARGRKQLVLYFQFCRD